MKHCIACGVLFEPLDDEQVLCDCCQDDLDECSEESEEDYVK